MLRANSNHEEAYNNSSTVTGIRISKMISFPEHKYVKWSASFQLGGIIITEPKQSVQKRYLKLLINSVQYITPNCPFHSLVIPFSLVYHTLSKGIVTSHDELSSTTFVPIRGEGTQKMYRILTIFHKTHKSSFYVII